MKAEYEIILSEMVTGHVILVEKLPEGKERQTDVTEDYILSIPAMQGHPNKDNTLITFYGVRISLGRRTVLANVKEQED